MTETLLPNELAVSTAPVSESYHRATGPRPVDTVLMTALVAPSMTVTLLPDMLAQ